MKKEAALSDQQKPRTLSLEEVSERTGIPLGKLQEQQAARQAQIRADSAVQLPAQNAAVSTVDEQPSWYNRLKGTAAAAYNSAADLAKESVLMVHDLGAALENSGTENSLPDQRIQRLTDSMQP